MSYDIVNPYPSVRIYKAIDFLSDQLNNDKDHLMKITKLGLKDIYELAELCLSKYYFFWNNEIRILKNLLDYLLWLFYLKVTFRIWNTKPLQKH